MAQLATAVLAYFATVAISVGAAVAHPWFDVESHFVKAVTKFSTVPLDVLSDATLPEAAAPTPH